MKPNSEALQNEPRARLESAYRAEKPRLMARLRKAGKSIEEAEDLIHEVYAETLERLPLIHEIRNLPAWINSLFTRRLIDLWRRDNLKQRKGETDVSEETIREVITEAGFNPLDSYVYAELVDALNTAISVLPGSQKKVIELHVFGGKTFREIAELSGESIDTISARKRYAVKNLARALP
ncbi:RNA polymerase sigma factor [Salinispira pacifica]|uniref:RNA polymerase sigma-54 factor RpoN n=1 Tax=Salinispira pacifica TaxID=1307761 RepID=V5WFT8_9SPIO|nr:sigma-70 family RNA polymerase sigma factor [Salinispira pacifica]AHC14006.1 RNA polymerase sigma-54 factor RpoN [Salinispira pacifica]